MFSFGPQRFLHPDAWNGNIAGSKRQIFSVSGIGWASNPFVIYLQFLRGLHVVEDNHLLRTDDGDLSQLVRIEPAQLDVGHLSIREPEAEKDHILNSLLNVALTMGRDDRGLFLKEIQDDRQVMGGKGPEGIFVLANDAEIDPLGIDVVDLSQFSGGNHFFQPVHHRVIDQEMADHENPLSLPGQLQHLRCILRVEGHGFFHQDVFVRHQRLFSQRGMGNGGGGNHNPPDLRVLQDGSQEYPLFDWGKVFSRGASFEVS